MGAVESLNTYTLMSYFRRKYIRIGLKAVNSETKFECALTLWFQKWQEELDELLLEHSNVWKIVH